jgi:Flp pilus assembly protein TadD
MKFILSVFALVLLLLAGTNAQSQTTGTRLAPYRQKTLVIWYDEPHEIAAIRHLLQEGQGERAVKLAREFVLTVSALETGGEGQAVLYYALNALCAALTKTGELTEAIGTCDKAIDLVPWKWHAYNNRGTAHFVSRDYASALRDYRSAGETLNDGEDARFIIESNIKLAESRLAGSR